MKNLLLTVITIFAFSALQAQDVAQIVKEDIRVQASAEQVREGLKKLEAKCKIAPEEKCNKGMSFGYYILSSRYYDIAKKVKGLDASLQDEALNKAKALFAKANALYPETALTDQQKYLLLDAKSSYEATVN